MTLRKYTAGTILTDVPVSKETWTPQDEQEYRKEAKLNNDEEE